MKDSITINDQTYTVPTSWNDLSLEQAMTCYQIIMQHTPIEFTLDETLPFKRLAMAKYLFGWSEEFLKEWEADCVAAEEGDAKMGNTVFLSELNTVVSQMTAFAFEEQGDNWQLRLDYTRCPYPDIKGKKGLRYFAPADELGNITLYELTMSFTAFEQYLETKDQYYLHQLIAILYRPGKKKSKALARAGYHGDRRLPLMHHESTIEARSAQMSRLPLEAKQMIVFWFASCRYQIVAAYDNVFAQPDKGAEKAGNDYGWATLLLELSGGLVNLKEVGNQLYSTGLTYLSYLEDKRKSQEAAMALRKR